MALLSGRGTRPSARRRRPPGCPPDGGRGRRGRRRSCAARRRVPASAAATSAKSGGAPPGESARSSTETTAHRAQRVVQRARAGNGRNDRTSSRPTGSLRARSSSTTSFTVPPVEPRQTIACSAPSSAYGSSGPVAASGELLELGGELLEDGERGLHRRELLMPQLEVVVGHRERPLRRRPRDVEQRVRDPVVADEVADHVVLEQDDRLGASA